MTFYIDCEENEALSPSDLLRLQDAMAAFVKTDVPVCVEVLFVDEEEIRRLNRETRNMDKVTDVLSYPTMEGIKGRALCGEEHPFEMDEEGRLLLGSVVVCVKRAKEQAEEYGHSYARELHYLLVHGFMHCLGYDHLTDEERAEMRKKEEFILGKLGIVRE